MKKLVTVQQIAHARAGDKGNTSSICVWAYEPRHYPALKAQLTAERIKAAYPDLFSGPVRRYEMEALHGLNFVLSQALEGGVNESLNLDSHGKSFSFLVLGMELEVEEAGLAD